MQCPILVDKYLAYAAVVAGALLVTGELKDDQGQPWSLDGAAPSPDARFEIAWLRGQLYLSGHTASTLHEQELLDLAAVSYPGRPVVTDFEPLGIVPNYWTEATLRVLDALVPMLSARAILEPERLIIRGVAVSNIDQQGRITLLASLLPTAITISHESIVVDQTGAAELCDDAFATFKAGSIKFEESSTTFRNSAVPELDRIAGIADACRDSIISITGHSDASGNEEQNHELSLSRANAVVVYLANAGIDHTRLRATGAGSSVPVADNATRYGRGLNRRIEIEFEIIDPAETALRGQY